VFNEITQAAVLHSFENPREIDMNLVEAQQARSILDKLVGYTVSPVLWRYVICICMTADSLTCWLLCGVCVGSSAEPPARVAFSRAGCTSSHRSVRLIMLRKLSHRCLINWYLQRERKRWDFMKSKFFSVHALLQEEGQEHPGTPIKAKLVTLGNRKVPTEADFDSATGELKECRGSSQTNAATAPLLLTKEKVCVCASGPALTKHAK
jgi:hypothetical protein